MTKFVEPVRNDRAADRYFWDAGQPGAAVPYIPFPVRREKIGDDIGSFGGAWVLRPAKNAGLRMTSLVEEESVGSWHAAVLLEPLQLFSYFDFAVPGIFAEAVAFAGED